MSLRPEDYNGAFKRARRKLYLQTFDKETFVPLEGLSPLDLLEGKTRAKVVSGRFHEVANMQLKHQEGLPIVQTTLKTPSQLVILVLEQAAGNPAFRQVMTDLISLHDQLSNRPTLPRLLPRRQLVLQALDNRGELGYREKVGQLEALMNISRVPTNKLPDYD